MSEILDGLVKVKASMQTKVANFSKLPILLKSTTDLLTKLKDHDS